jgi:hypothetical protein
VGIGFQPGFDPHKVYKDYCFFALLCFVVDAFIGRKYQHRPKQRENPSPRRLQEDNNRLNKLTY